MAKITFKDFAGRCSMDVKNLYTYKKRKQIIVDDNDMVDTSNEVNIVFLEKRKSKQINGKGSAKQEVKAKPQQIPRSETYIEPSSEDDDSLADKDGILPLPESERRKVHFAAIKIEKEIERLDIDIAKKRGEVIPSEPIIPVFLQHNQHILMEQKNADEEMLTAFAHKYSIDPADVAYIRGEWVKRRNAAIKKATEASVKGVASIVNDYSDRRGVGERG